MTVPLIALSLMVVGLALLVLNLERRCNANRDMIANLLECQKHASDVAKSHDEAITHLANGLCNFAKAMSLLGVKVPDDWWPCVDENGKPKLMPVEPPKGGA